jgi:spore coat protein U-like protein
MSRPLLVCLLAGMLLGAGARHAAAACQSVPTVNASFGSMTSFTIKNASQQTSTTSAGVRCSGALLSVLQSGDHFYLTVTSTNGGMKGPTGDIVQYTIYGDGSTSFPITPGVQYDYASGTLINLLGLFGGPAVTIPMFFRTVTGANVAAGAYSDTLTLSWSWNYCTGIGAFGVCLGRDMGSAVVSVQVGATVQTACQMTTPDVNFGSAPTVRAFSAVTQNIGVLCTKGTASYTVGVNSGQHASGGRRRMTSGGEALQYDIFKPSSSAVWGGAGGDRVSNSTTADGVNTQAYQYSAVIYTDQQTPAVGHYTDTVVVDVSF